MFSIADCKSFGLENADPISMKMYLFDSQTYPNPFFDSIVKLRANNLNAGLPIEFNSFKSPWKHVKTLASFRCNAKLMVGVTCMVRR
jgi:hypothetical protein